MIRSCLRVLFATRNPGKAREVREILMGLPITILTLCDLPDAPHPVEDGATFGENALKKARLLARWWGGLALADDSGLEVDALGGAPGVRSARYAGEGATDAQNNAKLLSELQKMPWDKRTARFVCILALVDPKGREWVVEGTCQGSIALEPWGEGGFGYDPVFFAQDLGKTFGEISPQLKNRISHRASALTRLRTVLVEIVSSAQDT